MNKCISYNILYIKNIQNIRKHMLLDTWVFDPHYAKYNLFINIVVHYWIFFRTILIFKWKSHPFIGISILSCHPFIGRSHGGTMAEPGLIVRGLKYFFIHTPLNSFFNKYHHTIIESCIFHTITLINLDCFHSGKNSLNSNDNG